MTTEDTMAQYPDFNVLHSFTKTGEPPLEAVVDKFLNPVSQGLLKDEESISEYVWKTGQTIIAVAAATTHTYQTRLVHFILELQKQVPKVTETGEALEHENGVIWRDLPAFGWVAREAWNFSPREYGVTAEQKNAWENQNAFLARLTAAASILGDDNRLDYSLYGLWVLREAFEEGGDKQTPSHGSLRAGCMWMLYAADALWENSKARREFGGRVGAGGNLFADRGWTGFTEERWALWSERLSAAERASDDGLEGLGQLLSEAAWQIQRVQSRYVR